MAEINAQFAEFANWAFNALASEAWHERLEAKLIAQTEALADLQSNMFDEFDAMRDIIDAVGDLKLDANSMQTLAEQAKECRELTKALARPLSPGLRAHPTPAHPHDLQVRDAPHHMEHSGRGGRANFGPSLGSGAAVGEAGWQAQVRNSAADADAAPHAEVFG